MHSFRTLVSFIGLVSLYLGRIRDEVYLEVNCQIVGLPIQYSKDNGEQWITYTEPVDVSKVKDLIILRTW